jgi:predicted nucleic acid-binding protein
MKCFDSTFVVDYLSGEPSTIEYLEARSTGALYLPAIVVYEAFEGGVKSAGPAGFRETLGNLAWADIAPFGEATALEAGRLQDELAAEGRELGSADAMIGGTARELGAPLVTRDTDFTNAEADGVLDIETY